MTNKNFLKLVKENYFTEENLQEWVDQTTQEIEEQIEEGGDAYIEGVILEDDDNVLIIGVNEYDDAEEFINKGKPVRIQAISNADSNLVVEYFSENGLIQPNWE